MTNLPSLCHLAERWSSGAAACAQHHIVLHPSLAATLDTHSRALKHTLFAARRSAPTDQSRGRVYLPNGERRDPSRRGDGYFHDIYVKSRGEMNTSIRSRHINNGFRSNAVWGRSCGEINTCFGIRRKEIKNIVRCSLAKELERDDYRLTT